MLNNQRVYVNIYIVYIYNIHKIHLIVLWQPLGPVYQTLGPVSRTSDICSVPA